MDTKSSLWDGNSVEYVLRTVCLEYEVPFWLYLGFHCRDFPESLYLAPSTYSLQTVKIWFHRFQASAAMLPRSRLFWDITWRSVVIVYRRLGTTYRSHLHGSRVLTSEDGTDTLSRNAGKQLPHNAA
jgi:hypothetical protein